MGKSGRPFSPLSPGGMGKPGKWGSPLTPLSPGGGSIGGKSGNPFCILSPGGMNGNLGNGNSPGALTSVLLKGSSSTSVGIRGSYKPSPLESMVIMLLLINSISGIL